MEISGLTLSTVLQMLRMDRNCCILLVQDGRRHGRMVIDGGELVDAQAGEERGVAAALRIIGWTETPRVAFRPLGEAVERTIDEPVERLLLEATLLRERLAAAPPESGKEEEMHRLQEVLDRFAEEVPDFISTDVVDIESGLSIGGGSIDQRIDTAAAPAAYAEVVKANRFALELLDLGRDATEDILITTDEVYLLIRLLGGDYYQLLAIGRRGNLGLARVIMKRYHGALMAGLREATRAVPGGGGLEALG